jgi:hypothetical protein
VKTQKVRKAKAKPKRTTTKRPAKPGSGLGDWRWVLAMLVILTFVILIWGKRIP